MPLEPGFRTHAVEAALPEALRSGITAGDISFSALQSYTFALEKEGYLRSDKDLVSTVAQPPTKTGVYDDSTRRMLYEVGLYKPTERQALRPEILKLIESLPSRDVSYSTGIRPGFLYALGLQSAPNSRKNSISADMQDLGVTSAVTEGATTISKCLTQRKRTLSVGSTHGQNINLILKVRGVSKQPSKVPLPLLDGAETNCTPSYFAEPQVQKVANFLPRLQPVKLPEHLCLDVGVTESFCALPLIRDLSLQSSEASNEDDLLATPRADTVKQLQDSMWLAKGSDHRFFAGGKPQVSFHVPFKKT